MFIHPSISGALLRQAVMVGVVFAWIGSVFALFPAPASPEYPAWPDGVLLGWATLSALLSLAGHVPWQNVLAVTGIVTVIAGAAFGAFAAAGLPGAHLRFDRSLGVMLFHTLPCVMLVVWLVSFLTARGVALLILRPWRGTARYGLWLISLTVALILVLAAGMEPLAVQVKHYWHWDTTATRWNWRGMLWPALAVWFVTGLLAQLAAVPWLVSKRPTVPPPDWHPLLLYSLVSLWIVAGDATRGLLGEAGITALATAVATALAVRGGTSADRLRTS